MGAPRKASSWGTRSAHVAQSLEPAGGLEGVRHDRVDLGSRECSAHAGVVGDGPDAGRSEAAPGHPLEVATCVDGEAKGRIVKGLQGLS